MSKPRVLVIGLDGWDHDYAERLRADGEMPFLSGLRDRSARFLLDPQDRQLDGLDWEHFVAGQSPERTQHRNAMAFDRHSYACWQDGGQFAPFFEGLSKRAVVFDLPYCDLDLAPSVQGIQGWGMSDPGFASTTSRPPSLLGDLTAHMGRYPSRHWLDGIAWPSVAQTQAMRKGLVDGVLARRQAARWLLGEAVEDWDLGIVVVTETHSGAEAFWHGVDAAHPLHAHPSAGEAADALRQVYKETDALIDELYHALVPDAIVVFALNGMAVNRFDVPSMCLLPELLFRWSFGTTKLTLPFGMDDSSFDDTWFGTELLGDELSWDVASPSWFAQSTPRPSAGPLARLRGKYSAVLTRLGLTIPSAQIGMGVEPIDWHPALQYKQDWPRMRAFALPSYSVGRIRLNLEGREREGIVRVSDYEQVVAEIMLTLDSARDLITGDPVVSNMRRYGQDDPLSLNSTTADIEVIWTEGVRGIESRQYGAIGPLPFRRLADHCGAHGFAWVAGNDVTPGDHGIRPELDLPGTIVDLLGVPHLQGVPDTSLLRLGPPTA